MSWITVALLSTAIIGVVNVFDSYFISRRMPSLQSFLIPPAILHLGFGLIIIAFAPLPSGIGAEPYLAAFASGIIRSIAVYLMLRAMLSEEVSRVIPVTASYPIFVAILAVLFLDEVLGLEDWMAICITVSGLVLISIRLDDEKKTARLRKSFGALMAASLFMGVADTTSKYALEEISFWNMYSINAFCFSATFLLTSLRRGTLKDLRNLKRRNLTMVLIALLESSAMAGIVMAFWAMERGPVSLVSTLLGTRPAVVFLFALALTRFLPSIVEERLTRGVVITKTVSIGLIIVGVTIINL